MKKAIIFLLFWTVALDMSAQAQRRDTVVLSVYNNNQRFMLYPMPFGKDKPDVDLTAPMVVLLDTVHLLRVATQADTSGRFPKRWATEHRCGKLPKDSLKGKVVLVYRTAGCDISTQVLIAQRFGAIAVIMMHTTDSKDSVLLPKVSPLFPYLDSSRVRIPCFTVRKSIGAKLTTMLPSLVGIKCPQGSLADVQSLKSSNSVTTTTAEQSKNDPTTSLDLDNASTTGTPQAVNSNLSNSPKTLLTNGTRYNWRISPNPTSDFTTVEYRFSQPTDVTIEVFNKLGQVLSRTNYKAAQSGVLDIDVANWASGVYTIHLTPKDNKPTVKKLVVGH